eukprot:4565529-Lingulodinium_polyedra.AAC.1
MQSASSANAAPRESLAPQRLPFGCSPRFERTPQMMPHPTWSFAPPPMFRWILAIGNLPHIS